MTLNWHKQFSFKKRLSFLACPRFGGGFFGADMEYTIGYQDYDGRARFSDESTISAFDVFDAERRRQCRYEEWAEQKARRWQTVDIEDVRGS